MKLLVFLIYLALIHLLQAYLPPDPVIETHRCASQINYRYNSSQLLCLCVPYTKAITLWRTCGLVASRLARHHCNILNSPFYYVYLPTCSMQQVSSSVCALVGAIHTPRGMAKGLWAIMAYLQLLLPFIDRARCVRPLSSQPKRLSGQHCYQIEPNRANNYRSGRGTYRVR